MLDEMDVKILRILQQDCTLPVAEVGKAVGLSTTPCWRRIQKLEEAGVIRRRVALLDAGAVNAGVTVFVSIKTDQHSLDWLERELVDRDNDTVVRAQLGVSYRLGRRTALRGWLARQEESRGDLLSGSSGDITLNEVGLGISRDFF